MAASPFLNMDEEDIVENKKVRFRTVGDMSCTAAVESEADEIGDIIAEISASKISERGARMDDKVSEAAMEDRKKGGYF
jgi:sulfate adenylyltransferase subunit 2